MWKRTILILAAFGGAAYGQCGGAWSSFASLTTSSNLITAMDSKPAMQCGSGAPTAKNGTVGHDLYTDTATGNLYRVTVTGTPATWALVSVAGPTGPTGPAGSVYTGCTSDGSNGITCTGAITGSRFVGASTTIPGVVEIKPGTSAEITSNSLLPASGNCSIFLDSADSNKVKLIDASGTVTALTAGCSASVGTVATPTDSPGAGTYTTSQAVTLSDSTSGATICYTTDGSTPAATTPGTCSTGSTYSTPFTLSATATVKALGTKAGLTNSGVLSSVYTIQVATPTDSPGQGTYSTTQTVTLSDATGSAVICYTTDGSTPAATTPGTCSTGTTYSGTISVSVTTTIKALGTKSGLTNSGVLTSVYTISSTVATPTDSPGTGTYTTSQAVTLSDGTAGATICYTIDGTSPAASTPGTCSAGSTYSTPFTISATATVKALGSKSGLTNSSVATLGVYTIQSATPTASPVAGSYSSTQTVTLSSTTGSAVICYTTDGSSPAAATPGTCSAGTTYSGTISVSATTTIKALATKVGLTNSGVLTATYTIGGISLVSSTAAAAAGASASVTSSAINTTGANLIVMYRASDDIVAGVSDSKGNTWTPLTVHGATGPSNSKLYYCYNPCTVGSGHTFTAGASGSPAQSIAIAAFSGVQTTGAFHVETGNSSAAPATTVKPGAFTPAVGELMITGVGWAISGGGTVSIDAGFTITNQLPFASGASYGVGLAYLIAPSAVSTDPTWTGSGASLAGMSSSMAGFVKQ